MDTSLKEFALERLALAQPRQLLAEAKHIACTCGDGDVRHYLQPCGHAVLCPECADAADSCPFCGCELAKYSANESPAISPRPGKPILELRLYDACVYANLIGQLTALGTWKGTGAVSSTLGMPSRSLASQFETESTVTDSGLRQGGSRHVAEMEEEDGFVIVPTPSGASGHKSTGIRIKSESGDSDALPLDVMRLFALFDVAADNGLASVISQYVEDECCDNNAVSSSAATAMLLDPRTVLLWAHRGFHIAKSELPSLYQRVDSGPISADVSCQLAVAAGRLHAVEKVACTMTNVAPAFLDDKAAAEAGMLLEALRRTIGHLQVMEWFSHEPLILSSNPRFSSPSEHQSEHLNRRSNALARALPDAIDPTGAPSAASHHNTPQAFLFIDSAASTLFFQEQSSVRPDYSALDTPMAYRLSRAETARASSAHSLGIEELCKGVSHSNRGLSHLNRGVSQLNSRGMTASGSAHFSYPPSSFRSLVDSLFLEASSEAEERDLAHRMLLYWLCDSFWKASRKGDQVPEIAQSCAAALGVPKAAVNESFLWMLLDDCSPQALEQACSMLMEGGMGMSIGMGNGTPRAQQKRSLHPRIARVLLERHQAAVALQSLRTTLDDTGLLSQLGFTHHGQPSEPKHHPLSSSSSTPSPLSIPLEHAVTAVRVLLASSSLTEAFAFHQWYTGSITMSSSSSSSRSKSGSNSNSSSVMFQAAGVEALTCELCWFCIRENRVKSLITLPWPEKEIGVVHACLMARANQDPASASGSLLVILYLERCRYRDAVAANEELEKIEKEALAAETEEALDSIKLNIYHIRAQRKSLLEPCTSLLPPLQTSSFQEGLPAGHAFDQSGSSGYSANGMAAPSAPGGSMGIPGMKWQQYAQGPLSPGGNDAMEDDRGAFAASVWSFDDSSFARPKEGDTSSAQDALRSLQHASPFAPRNSMMSPVASSIVGRIAMSQTPKRDRTGQQRTTPTTTTAPPGGTPPPMAASPLSFIPGGPSSLNRVPGASPLFPSSAPRSPFEQMPSRGTPVALPTSAARFTGVPLGTPGIPRGTPEASPYAGMRGFLHSGVPAATVAKSPLVMTQGRSPVDLVFKSGGKTTDSAAFNPTSVSAAFNSTGAPYLQGNPVAGVPKKGVTFGGQWAKAAGGGAGFGFGSPGSDMEDDEEWGDKRETKSKRVEVAPVPTGHVSGMVSHWGATTRR